LNHGPLARRDSNPHLVLGRR